MKQPYLTKETAKARIRFSALFENQDFAPKSSRFRKGKKYKNETLRPATNAAKSPYKTSLMPLIKPTRESIRKLPASSKTLPCNMPSFSLINKDVDADHSENSY